MKNFTRGFFMNQIENKFPSIWNSKCRNEINIKLYKETPDTQIARWLEENATCKEDKISASTIRRYRLYVNEHGGFKQLITPEDINCEDVTFQELDQQAMNLLYQRLPELEGGNFVQAVLGIFKYSKSSSLNINADVKSEVTVNRMEIVKQKRKELNDLRRGNRTK